MMNKVNEIKLVFTGSVGSGKTCAIATISEIVPVTTDVKSTEESVLKYKKTTTVAMDYGYLTLENGDRLNLYGTPGQRRFDFMSHILTKGALGLIVLINNAHEDPLSELDYYLNLNAAFLLENPAIIGVTHFDMVNQPSIEDYYQALDERGDAWPVICVDARDKEDINILLHVLVAALEQG
jgi:signal recognition particle receptor subunit beta